MSKTNSHRILAALIKVNVVIIILWIGSVALLNIPYVWESIISRSVNDRLKDSKISQLRIEKVVCSLFYRVKLSDVSFQLVSKSDVYKFFYKVSSHKLKSFDIRDISNEFQGLNIESDSFFLKNANLALIRNLERTFNIKGKLRFEQVQFLNYKFDNGYTSIDFFSQKTFFNHIKTSFANGLINGNVHISHTKNLDYGFNFRFNDLDFKELEKVNHGIFSKLLGHVDGELNIEANQKNVKKAAWRIKAQEGGKIHSSVVEYLSSTVNNQILNNSLINGADDKGFVPFELMQDSLVSKSEEQFTEHLILNSRALNVNIDVKIDYNIEGGVGNLLTFLKKFSFK